MKVTILGAGAFGTALGRILNLNGHETIFFDHKINLTLAEATRDAEAIVLAIPSQFAEEVLADLRTDLPLIVATKGMMSLRPFEKFEKCMFLSGPGFASDINEDAETRLTATDQLVVDLFTTDWLAFDLCDDAIGTMLCGGLKNIYALHAGFLNLQKDTVDHEEFLVAAAKEMKEILLANGGKAKTVDLSCGIGDLRLTCALPSRNYEFGQKVSQDPEYKAEKTVEGLSAVQKLREGVIELPKDAPIIKLIMEESKAWV